MPLKMAIKLQPPLKCKLCN